MRDLEEEMNSFVKQKLLTVKEDLLQNDAKVKRNLRIMVEIQHQLLSGNNKEWLLKVEGKLMSNESEEDILMDDTSSKRFLNFFERVSVEFPGGEYPSVEWVKAKTDGGSTFDCIDIGRNFSKEHMQR